MKKATQQQLDKHVAMLKELQQQFNQLGELKDKLLSIQANLQPVFGRRTVDRKFQDWVKFSANWDEEIDWWLERTRDGILYLAEQLPYLATCLDKGEALTTEQRQLWDDPIGFQFGDSHKIEQLLREAATH
jgi:hypothetical protein